MQRVRICGASLVKWFRFGYVASPATGQGAFTGRAAIPYSRSLPNDRGTFAFRFAPDCAHTGHDAGTGPTNVPLRLFSERVHFALRRALP